MIEHLLGEILSHRITDFEKSDLYREAISKASGAGSRRDFLRRYGGGSPRQLYRMALELRQRITRDRAAPAKIPATVKGKHGVPDEPPLGKRERNPSSASGAGATLS